MKRSQQEVVAVIPAFNEDQVIGDVVHDVRANGWPQVVVVDDGSHDATADQASAAGALVVRHKVNRGKGAATRTGLAAACVLHADIVVTLDGDGQHSARDIKALVAPLQQKQCDIVLGVRRWGSADVPEPRVIANYIGNLITWLLYGLWVRDSQSGMRAFSRRALEQMQLRSDRYEFESEIIGQIRRQGWRFVEVPISVRYTYYSMNKPHRQSLRNGLKAMYKMVWHLLT